MYSCKNKKKFRITNIILTCLIILLVFSMCACGSPSSEVEEALNEKYLVGYDEGYDDGYYAGYDEGYDAGYSEGRSSGFRDGYNEGEFDGYLEGQGDAEYGLYDPPEHN